MKVFHESLDKVIRPEIREASRTLDYGKGFYTTTSYEQAEAWVRRKMNEQNLGAGYVNVYEFDISALRKLNCLLFYKPTEDWLDFVMKNRTGTWNATFRTSRSRGLPSSVPFMWTS